MKKWIPLLLALLVLPCLAILKTFEADSWPIVTGYLVLISLSTFGLYWHDKRRARNGGWRVMEKLLHLLELLGGWPAAFLAQRLLHHKNSKRSYQVAFWLIVALHQAIALDYLLAWRISSRLFH